VRVLTWNLMHGRAVVPAGRELFEEFAAALHGWGWDVALLQEVPPWWPAQLGYEHRQVLTSRNWGLALRRAVAVRWPDLIKSNGGGANAILTREASISEHRVRRLSRLPERRWVHAVRLSDGLWVGNTHTEASAAQGEAAAVAVREWAGKGPAVLGGDFNVHRLVLPGFKPAGGHGVDQVFVRGVELGPTEVLDRGSLSDHAPVLVSVAGR
jgi:endonuclease/exonuclease/phosphatase family metal-dependent hydrolase